MSDDVSAGLIILVHITKGEIIRLGLIVLSLEERKTTAFSFSPLHLQIHMPTPFTYRELKYKQMLLKVAGLMEPSIREP